MALSSKTLLIVDDEKNTRDGLRDALEDHYEVYVAADIAGAFAALETEPADVLITDLRLAGEDGMELMEKVRKLPQTSDLHHDDGLWNQSIRPWRP